MKKSIYSEKQKKFIEKLKKTRKEAKLTQKQVAEKLGYTQSYLSKIESGQLKVDIFQIEELANIYKKEINYFIGDVK